MAKIIFHSLFGQIKHGNLVIKRPSIGNNVQKATAFHLALIFHISRISTIVKCKTNAQRPW